MADSTLVELPFGDKPGYCQQFVGLRLSPAQAETLSMLLEGFKEEIPPIDLKNRATKYNGAWAVGRLLETIREAMDAEREE